MSFLLQDQLLGGVSSSDLQKLVVSTAQQLDVEEGKALLLLMLCGWKEDELTVHYPTLQKIAPLLRRSLPDTRVDETIDILCPGCAFADVCVLLSCGHYLCHDCLDGHFRSRLALGHRVIACPAELCGKYINPKFVTVLPNATRVDHTRAILEDFRAQTYLSRFGRFKRGSRKVFGMVWDNKWPIILTALVGYLITRKIGNWMESHPNEIEAAGIVADHIKKDGHINNPSIWLQALVKAKYGVDIDFTAKGEIDHETMLRSPF